MVRWWNGTGWSDVATPAGPGVTVQRSPSPGRGLPAQRSAALEPVPPPARTAVRVGWVVGLSALLIVVAVVAGLLVGGSDEEQAVAEAPATVAPPLPPSSTFPPGTLRIIDDAAGISYPYLGEGWLEYDLGPQYEVTAIAGQYFTTQELTPDGSTFIAQCTSGPVFEDYGWAGPATLGTTMTTLADSVRTHYYPGPNELRVLRDEERTVDGHAARLHEFQLSWDVPGYDASGERAALLLIDVGRPAPALLYISIPNTHAELYGVIDRVIDDVDVL
jgi:hypothetical protein